jgi:hypothetical protein
MTLPFQVRQSARFSLVNSRGSNTPLAVGVVDTDHTFDESTVAFGLANVGPDPVFVDFTGASADPTLDGFPVVSGSSLPFLDVEGGSSVRLRSTGSSDVRIVEIRG